MNWCSLEMQTWVLPWWSFSYNGVAESFSSLLLAILMVEEGTSLILAWKLHLQWLRDVTLQPWLFMVFWKTVGSPPLIDVCWHKDACQAVMASCDPCPCCRCVRWCLRRWWKKVSDWLIWGELHPASHRHPNLNFGKTQCWAAFNIAHGLSLCLSTS